MEGNFATRLKLYIDSIGVSTTQFADSCEIPRPSFSQLLSGRNQKVSDVIIRKIHSVYPELSVSWLLFSEGEMKISQHEDAPEMDSSVSDSDPIAKNDGHISENPNIGKGNVENSNLRGLTPNDFNANTITNQHVEDSKKIIELQSQIENLQKNPRKVVQITVYYDDSTFETFFPASKP
ncbi:MAG: hypothetical protein J5995_01225 [Muribaculaceae bacterium]|nr:hypothetical protein [Muribaculaceae bacterium]